jgi:hypothetical protein
MFKTQKSKLKYYRQFRSQAYREGLRYEPSEVKMILAHSVSDRKLSLFLGRSIQAISVKRCKEKALRGII